MVATGPVRYTGRAAIQRDIADLKAALAGLASAPEDVFMPSVSPNSVGSNEHYGTQEDFLEAAAAALAVEYRAIVDAGFVVQIDDPGLADALGPDSGIEPSQRRRAAAQYVEILNHAIRDLPRERVRYHVCYGVNEGPRLSDVPLGEFIDLLLTVRAGAFVLEQSNPRHEHEYHLWEEWRLPEGCILMPGVISHASNIVEHPELIAERILRYARLVGRENVVAGADCGFSSQATYAPEVHPTVVWPKFEALAEGARLASRQLWP